jgi:disulfide bond formation protein DsbB
MLARLFERPAVTAAGLILVGGLAAILAAWGFELIGGYAPCKLCLEQRTPYYVGLPLVLVALVSNRLGAPSWLARACLVLAGLAFAYGAALGIYQAGAQWSFWQGPTDCGATRGGGVPTSAMDLLSDMGKTRIPSCTDVDWRMFGLSFAGWNAVVSGGIVLLAAWGTFARRHRTAAHG